MYIYIFTDIYIYIYTYTHTHIYIYMYNRLQGLIAASNGFLLTPLNHFQDFGSIA